MYDTSLKWLKWPGLLVYLGIVLPPGTILGSLHGKIQCMYVITANYHQVISMLSIYWRGHYIITYQATFATKLHHMHGLYGHVSIVAIWGQTDCCILYLMQSHFQILPETIEPVPGSGQSGS